MTGSPTRRSCPHASPELREPVELSVDWLHGALHDWLIVPAHVHDQMHRESMEHRHPSPRRARGVTLDPDRRRFLRYTGATPAPPGITGACWIWTGARDTHGIPVWWQAGRTRFPHIWAWAAEHGPKPAGMQLSPVCHRSVCVRPDHRVLRRRGSHLREGAA